MHWGCICGWRFDKCACQGVVLLVCTVVVSVKSDLQALTYPRQYVMRAINVNMVKTKLTTTYLRVRKGLAIREKPSH